MNDRTEDRLSTWKERYEYAKEKYRAELDRMDRRERLYKGDPTLWPVTEGDTEGRTPHVRNLVAEIIEAEVDSGIPAVKVTALHREDEELAAIIEAALRNEVDRMPTEYLNDMQERIVPTQGGSFYLVEWDNAACTHDTVGEIKLTARHPRTVIPQPGVYSGVQDMDYLFTDIPCTKETIRARYGREIDAGEEDPGVRGPDAPAEEELVTLHVAYYRNLQGGVGLYAWAGDVELEDLEDCESRRPRRCTVCGRGEDGTGRCACGSTSFHSAPEETERLDRDVVLRDGRVIPAGTEIDYYRPRAYPVVLQKNTYGYGRLLGDSDVDKIEAQQNTVNRLERKILDLLCAGGSVLTLPDDAAVETGPREMRVVYPHSLENKAMIGAVDLQGDVSQAMAFMAEAYEEARQTIGITDSYQGRRDSTAVSGTAKQFAAQQSAGRLQSKRVMKRAAWAEVYRLMFLWKLAYSDEPRTVRRENERGRTEYGVFSRYDFLKQDAAGKWYYEDRFLFSCDDADAGSRTREALWQETRANLQGGAFGDPADAATLILFWTRMEQLHYPGAADVRACLEERRRADAKTAMDADRIARRRTEQRLREVKSGVR